jgi:excisionase family DNA binding protein
MYSQLLKKDPESYLKGVYTRIKNYPKKKAFFKLYEISYFLGCSKRTVYRWIKECEIPATRTRRRGIWLIPRLGLITTTEKMFKKHGLPLSLPLWKEFKNLIETPFNNQEKCPSGQKN